MSKVSIISITAILRLHIKKQDTKYRRAILIVVRLACTLYKLKQGVSLMQFLESFVGGAQKQLF